MSRRSALGLLGAAGAAGVAVPLLGTGTADARPAAVSTALHVSPGSTGAPPVVGLHLTFGSDPARHMVVSWLTETAVRNPRVLFGSLAGGFGSIVRAQTRTYVDGVSKRAVYVHHADLQGLHPATSYIYAAQHDGANPDAGTFATAPSGRAPFTFTSFGDQAVPQVTWGPATTTPAPNSKYLPTTPDPYVPAFNANNTAASYDIVAGIEKISPLFHLMNGDLCYANLDPDRVRTWNEWFVNNGRSAKYRPWMPAAGNHEIEVNNGEIGLSAFQTYFKVPSTESDPELDGLWYSFTAGSVHVIVLQNDDICLQDGGDVYIHGYSGGRQLRWLERELANARRSKDVDWVVVCMHQVMVSTSDANGSDLGLRQAYGPLFDKYGVDLVVCGHEHDYERSHPVRGVVAGSETLTPKPSSTNLREIDSDHGTVHMVLGGGGVSGTTNQAFFADGTGKVIVGVADSRPTPTGRRASTYVQEKAVWSAVRDPDHPYGFAAFTVDPGNHRGGQTKLHVTYYNVTKPTGALEVFETFTLQRRRCD